ncbi:lipid-A-disaccharide synthase [Alphaproteobacteria bacterium]|nr:lipid-A-disaccharide synthase [Alphaproteobacteria bacterium]
MIKIVLVAGEPSGDLLGAQLMKALKKKEKSPLSFYGIGGALMEAEGLKSFCPLSDLSIMGFFENWKKLLKVKKRLKETGDSIVEINPDVIITIDFPGFNFRLGRFLKTNLKNTPLIHYVAPTVWAWRKGRAKSSSKFLDHFLALFPFEPIYFKKYKPITFVGHPVVEMGFDEGRADRFQKKHGISKKDTLLTLLPGSRAGELKRHLPIFMEMVQLLKKRIPNLKIVMPTVPEVEIYLKKHWKSEVPTVFTVDHVEKVDAYAASQMAIAASGTVALELSQAGLPMIITYKISVINAFIVRQLIQMRYFCMINILLRKKVVPELLQKDCTAQKLSLEALKILRNPQKQEQQRDAFKQVGNLLKPKEGLPSEKAAEVIQGYFHLK